MDVPAIETQGLLLAATAAVALAAAYALRRRDIRQ